MISFPTGRNHHHSAAIISLHAPQQRQRKNVVCLRYVVDCLHLCFSTAATDSAIWLNSGEELRKKIYLVQSEFLSFHILAWPSGQF